MSDRPSIKIYACGGTGINLGYGLAQYDDDPSLAQVSLTYIDTSRSDVRNKSINEDNFYHIKGADDGSGKRRDTNYEAIKRAVPSILEMFPPYDLNIIICSASGGTGSVVATELLPEIYALGGKVILFIVGSHESELTCSNTIKTWNSLSGVCRTHDISPIVNYDDNGSKSASTEVDESIIHGILAWMDLYSGQHKRLDNRDILNFVDVTKTLRSSSEVLLMDILINESSIDDYDSPHAIASLFNDEDEVTNYPADYNCEGIRTTSGRNLFFIIHNNNIDRIINELKSHEVEFKRRRATREKRKQNSLMNSDTINADGIDL